MPIMTMDPFTLEHKSFNSLTDADFADATPLPTPVEQLSNLIQSCYDQIEQIQLTCAHTVVDKKHHSSDGHWDGGGVTEPERWTEFTCKTCQKDWTVDGTV